VENFAVIHERGGEKSHCEQTGRGRDPKDRHRKRRDRGIARRERHSCGGIDHSARQKSVQKPDAIEARGILRLKKRGKRFAVEGGFGEYAAL
jgi:hypothetical protein